MTKKRFIVFLLLTLLLTAAIAEGDSPRVLVAFLSRAGENYNVGVAREGSASAAYAGYIEKGNTAIVAAAIAEAASGDLFEIRTVIPYPEDYDSMLKVAQEEIDADARPELAAHVENMADYNVVFIGYPIWHGRMPQAIFSFIEEYEMAGKIVIPFNTHEGSGQSGTQRVIEDALPGCTVLQGLAIQGKVAQEDPQRTRTLIDEWLEGMNMKKSAAGAEAEVLATYEAIQQAMIDKDIRTLDRLYQDGTMFTHMSGKKQTKAEFFDEIADGTLNYFAYRIENPRIRVDGDEAALTASVTLTAKVYGTSGSWTLPVNAHFTKTDGQWIVHN
ncbi:MAG: DUF4440 domain-containing protein [Clostridiales bacterium]|nr:DUF4440 domain-containing protein [Clostridiales bacterium]